MYKAWPYQEATKIIEKIDREEAAGIERKHEEVLLETGFGPSGLPHIGTFSEVARTNWVLQAYELMADRPVKLVAFSDDMDGMRGIPLDTPNPDALIEHLGKPLCDVPDPYGEHESFAGHMNAKLREFLDSFGFNYEFKSSQEQYRGGVFDEGLKRIVDCYDEIRELVTKDLREETAQTWSPFRPICEKCGRVNTTRVVRVNRDEYTVTYACDKPLNAKLLSWDERPKGKEKRASKDARPYYEERVRVHGCGHEGTLPVTGGALKVGWKVDWALRWYVFGVDYEMYGKDLIDSAQVSGPIVKILGGEPPAGMVYEWFNDEHGQSISKTKGNGLTIDEWLQYGPLESLGWYVYQSPAKAKKLFFGVIPQSTDKFLGDRTRFGQEEHEDKVNNPIWFVEHARHQGGAELGYDSEITFGLLLNLVSVLNTERREIIWDYILRYDENAKVNEAILESMIDCALNYYRDFVAPTKKFEAVPEEMLPALEQFISALEAYEGDSSEELQSACYTAGKENGLKLGKWFKALYRLLLGQDRGPRIGTFVHLYGIKESIELIRERQGELAG